MLFPLLAVTNNAAMSLRVQVCVWIFIFISLVYIPRSGIADSW